MYRKRAHTTRRGDVLKFMNLKLVIFLCIAFIFVFTGVWKDTTYAKGDSQTSLRSQGSFLQNLASRKLSNNSRSRRLNIVPIPRIKYADTLKLSYEEFFARTTSVPIILEGVAKHHPLFYLDFKDIQTLCGDAQINATVYSDKIGNWNRHSRLSQNETLRHYIEDQILSNNTGEEHNLRYASDIIITEQCMVVERLFKYNKFVTFDLQHEIPYLDMYHLYPVFYAGAAGTHTGLHFDGGYMPFWMNVYMGSKRFRGVEFNEVMSLIPKLSKSDHPVRKTKAGKGDVKRMSLFYPDYDIFPELSDMTIYEGSVNAGDFLFMPSGMMHEVHNDQHSLGITANSLSDHHLKYFYHVLDTKKAKQGMKDFQTYSGCAPIHSEEDFVECVQYSLVWNGHIRRRNKHKLEDLFMHELFGFESSDDFCFNQQYLIELENSEYLTSPKGEWLRYRQEHSYEVCQVDKYANLLGDKIDKAKAFDICAY